MPQKGQKKLAPCKSQIQQLGISGKISKQTQNFKKKWEKIKNFAMSDEKVIEISESEDDSDIEVIPNPVELSDTESANQEVIVVSDDEVEINEIPEAGPKADPNLEQEASGSASQAQEAEEDPFEPYPLHRCGPRVRYVKESRFAPGKISNQDRQLMCLAPKI